MKASFVVLILILVAMAIGVFAITHQLSVQPTPGAAEPATATRPENFPSYFRVPERATNVRYDPESVSVTFQLIEPFPATGLIESVNKDLKAAGFRKLNKQFHRVEIDSSHVAGFETGKDPNGRLHRWNGNWIRGTEEVVSMMIFYPPSREEAPSNAKVSFRLEPTGGNHQQLLDEYFAKNPDEQLEKPAPGVGNTPSEAANDNDEGKP